MEKDRENPPPRGKIRHGREAASIVVKAEPYGGTPLIPPMSDASHTPGFFLSYFTGARAQCRFDMCRAATP